MFSPKLPPNLPPPSHLAARIQSSIQQSTPFIGSPDGDVFLIPSPQDASPLHLRDALASLVREGSVSSYRYLGESSPPVILAVTPATHG